MRAQGGLLSVSGWRHARRRRCLRTVKSCGPDASTLASSLAEARSAQPGLDKTYPQAMVANKPGSPGRARRKPLKPLRAGMPGDSGVLVVTRVRSTTTKCTRGRGCNGHPAFPTPSLGGRFINGSGALRGEGVNARLDVIASEAKQSIKPQRKNGLLRGACHRARIRATRWLAMTVYFGFSKIEYKHATLSVVIAREGACEGYGPHPEERALARLEGWPRVPALRPSFETLASQAPQDEVRIPHNLESGRSS